MHDPRSGGTVQCNDTSVFQNFRIRSVATGNSIDDNFQGLVIYVSEIIALHLMMQSMMYNYVCIFSFNLLESLFISGVGTVFNFVRTSKLGTDQLAYLFRIYHPKKHF